MHTAYIHTETHTLTHNQTDTDTDKFRRGSAAVAWAVQLVCVGKDVVRGRMRRVWGNGETTRKER